MQPAAWGWRPLERAWVDFLPHSGSAQVPQSQQRGSGLQHHRRTPPKTAPAKQLPLEKPEVPSVQGPARLRCEPPVSCQDPQTLPHLLGCLTPF